MDLWEKLGNVTYIRPAEKCKGGSEVMNIGFKYCRNDLLVSMNNDVEVLPGWLEEAVNVMQSDEKIGVVGMKFLYPDGKIQHAGGIFIKSGLPFHLGIGEPRESHSETREMPWVSGPCVLVRRLCLDPGWDEIYDTFGGHEDVDLCLRARAAGWKVLYCGKSEVYHHEGATVLNMPDFGHQHIRAREMFLARWSKNPMLK
jgi:GT2 family glycosyltransferase